MLTFSFNGIFNTEPLTDNTPRYSKYNMTATGLIIS